MNNDLSLLNKMIISVQEKYDKIYLISKHSSALYMQKLTMKYELIDSKDKSLIKDIRLKLHSSYRKEKKNVLIIHDGVMPDHLLNARHYGIYVIIIGFNIKYIHTCIRNNINLIMIPKQIDYQSIFNLDPNIISQLTYIKNSREFQHIDIHNTEFMFVINQDTNGKRQIDEIPVIFRRERVFIYKKQIYMIMRLLFTKDIISYIFNFIQ